MYAATAVVPRGYGGLRGCGPVQASGTTIPLFVDAVLLFMDAVRRITAVFGGDAAYYGGT
eukprot:3633941-Rhodomonas_salina.6